MMPKISIHAQPIVAGVAFPAAAYIGLGTTAAAA